MVGPHESHDSCGLFWRHWPTRLGTAHHTEDAGQSAVSMRDVQLMKGFARKPCGNRFGRAARRCARSSSVAEVLARGGAASGSSSGITVRVGMFFSSRATSSGGSYSTARAASSGCNSTNTRTRISTGFIDRRSCCEKPVGGLSNADRLSWRNTSASERPPTFVDCACSLGIER